MKQYEIMCKVVEQYKEVYMASEEDFDTFEYWNNKGEKALSSIFWRKFTEKRTASEELKKVLILFGFTEVEILELNYEIAEKVQKWTISNSSRFLKILER